MRDRVQKAGRKGRSEDEVGRIIAWPTGCDPAALIKDAVCGLRMEQVEDPAMRRIRHLD